MSLDPDFGDRIDQFALVSYIPEPLAGFLDRLRRELVPNCFLRAHITILPPRPNSASPDIAWMQLREAAGRFEPFDIELKEVDVFRASDVIYMSVGDGERQLRSMHAALNAGALGCPERFEYHPHVTLAQDLKHDEVDELVEVARRRWASFASGRRFRVDTLTFVQNTLRKVWLDLAECKLEPALSPEPALRS